MNSFLYKYSNLFQYLFSMSHADVKHTMQWGWINVYNNQDRHFHHPESSLLTPFYWSPSILGSRCFDLGYQDFTFSWIFMQNGEWTEFVYVSDFFLLVVLEIHSCCQFSSVSQSCPTLCNPMHCSTPDFRLSPTPGAYSNSCPSSLWCHPTISSSVIPFPSCLQSFPASGSFLVSQFFTSGGQRIGVSASVSVLAMNIQDWFPSGLTDSCFGLYQ